MACLLVTLGCGGLALVLLLSGALGWLALSFGDPIATETPPTTVRTTAAPASPGATTSTARVHPTDVAYANDSYQVPPVQTGPIAVTAPTSDAAAMAMLTGGPLYAGAVASPVRCPNDPMLSDPDLTQAALKVGIERHVTCLMRVWQPLAAKAGLPLRRPDVVVFTKTTESPCGTLAVDNFYCSENVTLYFQSGPPRLTNADGQVTFRMENLVAHEFGHHVQATFGLLHAQWYFASRAAPDAALEWSRRLELQADCLMAVAWTATARSQGGTQADVDSMLDVARQLGDHPDRPGDHGKSESAVLWVTRGLQGKPSACTTFAAPASEVR